MTNGAMCDHVIDLLKRVEVRVPKLIDQLALAEIREVLADSERVIVCENCNEELECRMGNQGDWTMSPCPTCYPEDEDGPRKLLLKIARHSSNEPEVLRLVEVGLKRYKEGE